MSRRVSHTKGTQNPYFIIPPFPVCISLVGVLVFNAFASGGGGVETDDEQCIINHTQAGGICLVLCERLAQPRPSLAVFGREDADGGTSNLDIAEDE